MKLLPKFLVIAFSVAFLPSCAELAADLENMSKTPVITDVSAYHKLPAKGAGETFKIKSKKRAVSLAEKSYLTKAEEGLIKYGWKKAETNNPDYIVTVDYSISKPRKVQQSQDVWGRTGGGYSYNSGNISGTSGYNNYNSQSYTAPQYGVVGAVPVTVVYYDRKYDVIINNRNGERVLEGKATSTGTNGELSRILPYIIDSFFDGFPGESSKTREVYKYMD